MFTQSLTLYLQHQHYQYQRLPRDLRGDREGVFHSRMVRYMPRTATESQP